MSNVNESIEALMIQVEPWFSNSLAAKRSAEVMADLLFTTNAQTVQSLIKLEAGEKVCARAHHEAVANLRSAAWSLMGRRESPQENKLRLELADMCERELKGDASIQTMMEFWKEAMPLLEEYPKLDILFECESARKPGTFSIWKSCQYEDRACASINLVDSVCARAFHSVENNNFYEAARKAALEILPNFELEDMRLKNICTPGSDFWQDFLPRQVMNIAVRNVNNDGLPWTIIKERPEPQEEMEAPGCSM